MHFQSTMTEALRQRCLSQVFEDMREDGTLEEILGNYLEHPEDYLEVDTCEK